MNSNLAKIVGSQSVIIYVRWMDTGQTALITNVAPSQSSIAWAPDGKNIAFTKAAGTENNPKVSPNSKYIAYSKRDDKKVAYRNSYLHVMEVSGENDRNLSANIDNSLSNFHWQDSAGLFYQQMLRGITQINYVTLSTAKHNTVTIGLGGTTLGRPYTSGTFDYASGTFAFTKGRHDRPADIYVLQGKKQTQLTQLNEDLLGHKTLDAINEFTYESSIDGEEIHGWYILPPNYDNTRKYPLITEIHGGPHLAYGPHFSAELQRMAAEGYIVFYNNHRGSTGYGERFALLLQNKYSSKYDFSDHMSASWALSLTDFIHVLYYSWV